MKQLFQNNTISRFFSSVKLSVFLLLTLAIVSIIGTVLPQGQTTEYYVTAYGQLWGKLILLIGADDTYHSLWYRLLMGLLSMNIIVCSIDRLSATWAIIFPKTKTVNVMRFRKKPDRIKFDVMDTVGQIREAMSQYLSKKMSHCELISTDQGFYFYGETGRKSRLGVYAVHFSVLVMILGGIIGSFFGFEGHVQIPEGEQTKTISMGQNQKMVLPFTIRCDDFSVSFYENGSPSEFKSVISLIRNDHVILTKPIVVNHPLRYEGINIFQSSYGLMTPEYKEKMPETVILFLQNPKTHLSYPLKTKLNQRVEMPEGKGFITIQNYQSSYRFGGHSLGPTLTLVLESKSSDATNSEISSQIVMIPVQYESFDRMRQGHFVISVMNESDFRTPETDKRYYTGLQVTKDPGIWFVYTGFLVMLLGIFVTFFVSHRQYFVEVIEKSPGSCQAYISGVSNKNRLGMIQKLDRLKEELQKVCINIS
jgi:cytochrome c biogenesis protein